MKKERGFVKAKLILRGVWFFTPPRYTSIKKYPGINRVKVCHFFFSFSFKTTYLYQTFNLNSDVFVQILLMPDYSDRILLVRASNRWQATMIAEQNHLWNKTENLLFRHDGRSWELPALINWIAWNFFVIQNFSTTSLSSIAGEKGRYHLHASVYIIGFDTKENSFTDMRKFLKNLMISR